MSGSVIVAGARTPIGAFMGSLSAFTAPELGAIAIKEALIRAGISPDEVDEVIMGEVLTGAVVQRLPPQGQVGPQPHARLLAPACSLGWAELRPIPPQAVSGQDGAAGREITGFRVNGLDSLVEGFLFR